MTVSHIDIGRVVLLTFGGSAVYNMDSRQLAMTTRNMTGGSSIIMIGANLYGIQFI